MASWPNQDGAAGTLAAMREAAHPADAADDLPARVAHHDGILADHGLALDAHAGLLGEHQARLDALDGGHQPGADEDISGMAGGSGDDGAGG